jgi:hypothetical protein
MTTQVPNLDSKLTVAGDVFELDMRRNDMKPERLERTICRTAAPELKVDRQNHVIRGGVVISAGVLKDGRAEIDDTLMDQIVEAGNARGKGIRCRFDHPMASSRSMGTQLGRLRNFRRGSASNGTACVLADIHLMEVASRAPEGDLRSYVLELAEEDDGQLGLSVVIELAKRIYRRTDEGELERDENDNVLPPFWRLKKLLAVDIVDEPASQDGMFSANTPAGQVVPFLDRYFSERGMLPTQKQSDQDLADDPGASQTAAQRSAAAAPESESEETMKHGKSETAGDGNATKPAANKDRTPPADPPAEQLSAAEVDKIRKEAEQAAIARVQDIQAAAKDLGITDGAAVKALIDDTQLSTDQACRKLISLHTAKAENKPLEIAVVRTRQDRFEAASYAGLVMRMGLTEDFKLSDEDQALGADLRHVPLAQLAQMCCEFDGVETRGKDIRAKVGLALNSTGTFPKLLENVTEKRMLMGFEFFPQTYERWTKPGSTNDFKQFTRLRVSEADDLLLKPEGAEIEGSTLTEARERGQCYTYARSFRVTRELIINDDMGQILRQPERFGQSARRLIGDLVYDLLIGPTGFGPLMGDGTRLFVNDVNWFNDSDLTLNSTLDLTNGNAALDHAAFLMMTRTGLAAKDTLGLEPRFLLIPPKLRQAARILMNSSANVADSKNAGVVNAEENLADIIVEPRLRNTAFNANASETAWYLIADPRIIDTIEVTYLNGVRTPFMEREARFSTDDIEFKVRHDVAVTALESRSIVKSKGGPA